MLGGMDTVGDLMTRDVLTVDPADSLGEAAEKMIDHGVGALVVSDFGNIIGIVTKGTISQRSSQASVTRSASPSSSTDPPSDRTICTAAAAPRSRNSSPRITARADSFTGFRTTVLPSIRRVTDCAAPCLIAH